MFNLATLTGSDARSVLAALDRSLGIIEFDVNGIILSANANFCDALGYALTEIKGQHHKIFVDPAYAASPAYRQFWEKLGRGEFEAKEYRRIGKNGRDIWIQASYNPIKRANGSVTKIVKVAADITAQKMRDIETDGKLTAISRVQAVIEFTPAGEILSANENFLSVMGYRLDEIKGKHHRLFVSAEDQKTAVYQQFWAKLSSGEFVEAVFKRIGKDGKPVWIRASYNPIFDLNGKVLKVVKFASDVSSRIEAIAEIKSGLAQLASNNLEV